jgi:hypothetical protein
MWTSTRPVCRAILRRRVVRDRSVVPARTSLSAAPSWAWHSIERLHGARQPERAPHGAPVALRTDSPVSPSGTSCARFRRSRSSGALRRPSLAPAHAPAWKGVCIASNGHVRSNSMIAEFGSELRFAVGIADRTARRRCSAAHSDCGLEHSPIAVVPTVVGFRTGAATVHAARARTRDGPRCAFGSLRHGPRGFRLHEDLAALRSLRGRAAATVRDVVSEHEPAVSLGSATRP